MSNAIKEAEEQVEMVTTLMSFMFHFKENNKTFIKINEYLIAKYRMLCKSII